MGPATLLPIIGLALFLRRRAPDRCVPRPFLRNLDHRTDSLPRGARWRPGPCGFGPERRRRAAAGQRDHAWLAPRDAMLVPPVSLVLLVVLSGVFLAALWPHEALFFDEYYSLGHLPEGDDRAGCATGMGTQTPCMPATCLARLSSSIFSAAARRRHFEGAAASSPSSSCS